MTAARRRIRSLLLLGIVASLVIPGVANAAPSAVSSVTVFGNKRPVDADCGDTLKGCSVVYANSQPFGADGPHGSIYFEGLANPSQFIDVIVDDEPADTDGTFVRQQVTSAPAGSTLENDGYLPGEFGWHVPCGFRKCADLNHMPVTELGEHKADATAGPSSTDPADWGGSTLYVNFTVLEKGPDGKFLTSDDLKSTTVTKTVTKYAGSPLDNIAPQIRGATFPPNHWCHLSGTGMKMGALGFSLGGESTGKCSDFAQAPLGAIPDVTWIGCADPHRILVDPSLPSLRNPLTQITGRSEVENCRTNQAQSIPKGEARLTGLIYDDHDGADGLASEIAEVKLEFLQGAALYRPTIILTDHFNNSMKTANRFGARAGYGLPIRISEFEPNWPGGVAYQLKITATDAWGNTATASSGDIWVYPY